jgi:hypothetical protein
VEFGNAVEHAYALLGFARCDLAMGKAGGDVEVALAQARGIFERLGARPLIAETDGLLAGQAAAAG